MGQVASWAMGLLNCTLWHLGLLKRPGCYYAASEIPSRKTLEPSQMPGGFALNSQALLWYAYWLIMSMLGVIAVSSVGLSLQRLLRAQQDPGKEEMAVGGADPEEVVLVEMLHLLDALMEKTLRHLHRRERRRRRRRER